MSIANKLKQIINIKESIRQAIISKGVACDTAIPFEQYPNKIKLIKAGGSGGPTDYVAQSNVYNNSLTGIFELNAPAIDGSFLFDNSLTGFFELSAPAIDGSYFSNIIGIVEFIEEEITL